MAHTHIGDLKTKQNVKGTDPLAVVITRPSNGARSGTHKTEGWVENFRKKHKRSARGH
jgi:hypothetical protein